MSQTNDSSISRGALLGGAFVIVLAVLFVYIPSLAGEFVYDDLLVIQQNPQITSLANLPTIFTSSYWDFLDADSASHVGYYRPLSVILLTVGHVLGDGDPWWFHFISVTTYILACLAAWRFAARLLKSEAAGFWAALLFAVHPLHVESIAWISALHDPLFACFGLMSLGAFLRWRDEGSSGRPWIAGLWFLLALLAKDAAVAILPLALVIDWGREHRGTDEARPAIASPARAYAPLVVALAFYYMARVIVFGDIQAGFDRTTTDFGVGFGRLALLRLEILGGAAWLLAWPAELNLFRPFHPVFPDGSSNLLIAVAGSGAIVALTLVAWIKRSRTALVALLMIPAALAPVLFRVQALGTFPLSDRFLFLSVLGFTLLVAHLAWSRLPRVPAIVVLGGLALALGLRSAAHIPSWANEEALFTKAVDQSPRSPNVHWGIGRVQLQQFRETGEMQKLTDARLSFEAAMELLVEAQEGATDVYAVHDDHLQANLGLGWALLHEAEYDPFHDYATARTVFQRVIEYRPDSERGYIGLGVAWLTEGEPNQASVALRKAISLNENSPEAHFNMGLLLMRISDWEGAASEFRHSLALRPNNLEDMAYLSRALQESGQDPEAEVQARRAHELYPEAADPMVLLGILAARKARYPDALSWLDRALAVRPENGAAHLQRGKVLAELGQGIEAVKALQEACNLMPSNFEAHYNLMVLLLTSNKPETCVPTFLHAYRLRPRDTHDRPLRAAAEQILGGDANALGVLATIDAERGAYDLARDWIDKALAIDPLHGVSNYILGTLLLQQGERDLAYEPLLRGAQALPDSYQAQMDLAELLLDLGRERETSPYLIRAMQLLPKTDMTPELRTKTRETIQTALDMIATLEPGSTEPDGKN